VGPLVPWGGSVTTDHSRGKREMGGSKRKQLPRDMDASETKALAEGMKGVSHDVMVKDFTVLSKELASRVLYPNPVCFLTTRDAGEKTKTNVMTISWLTAANNFGGVVLVMNKARFSANALKATGKFTLSVATDRHKELLVRIGKMSGRSVNKFADVDGLMLSKQWVPGDVASAGADAKRARRVNTFEGLNDDSESESDPEDKEGKKRGEEEEVHLHPSPVANTAAHLLCSVTRIDDAADPGHHLIVAQVDAARVSPRYFDGKLFAPRPFEGRPTPEPYLSFLGSQTFASIERDADGKVDPK
jgi:flavin reductase (DIM6/NTAB) family NADH-FMN oxidoreductase RutF